MRLACVCIVLLCAVVLALPAAANVINFDSDISGAVVSGPGVYSDVEFSNGGNDITVMPLVPGPVFSAPNCAIGTRDSSDNWSPYRADFKVDGVYFVSVVLGDFDGDSDNLYLKAYDSADVLLGESNFYLDASVFGGPTLSVSAADISYAVFGSNGEFPNSVYMDDFTYKTSAVPEPATLLGFGIPMLMIGLSKLKSLRK